MNRREVARYLKKSAEEHEKLYVKVGHISTKFTGLQTLVHEMFLYATNMDYAVCASVFHSQRSDAGQRDMTAAALRARLTGEADADALRKAIASLNKLGDVAGLRNAFIHTYWAYDTERDRMAAADQWFVHPRVNAEKDALQEADEVIVRMNETTWELMKACDAVRASPSVRILLERREMDRTSLDSAPKPISKTRQSRPRSSQA
jgi:hypothetical protein